MVRVNNFSFMTETVVTGDYLTVVGVLNNQWSPCAVIGEAVTATCGIDRAMMTTPTSATDQISARACA